MNSNRELKPDASWRMALVSVGIALSLPGTIGVPAVIGYFLDQRFGTQPTLLMVGFLIGLFGAGFEVYILMKRMKEMK